MKYLLKEQNFVPDTVNPTPDYYCTWQTQLYATSDGKPEKQRAVIGEQALFGDQKPYGWAHFYEQARRDLILVMDDSWDVPFADYKPYYGSVRLNAEKFPSFADADGLKRLTARIRELGWKGLGGWVCAQESERFLGDQSPEEYWKDCFTRMNDAGFAYWKVDWGKHDHSLSFRRMLTDLAEKYAPHLIVEHALIPEIIPYSDVFRTYDVPAILSIPMTMQKLQDLADLPAPVGNRMGLIDCEDEVYVAAAGGFAMGVMRHPFVGALPDGRPDMSFPAFHRNLKTKLYEVLRAVRFHRIAPAFAARTTAVSSITLTDTWKLNNREAEFESWWFDMESIHTCMQGDTITKTAPAAIARDTDLPGVIPNEQGEMPFVVAAHHPNGVFSIATLGRTIGRQYGIPHCDVTAFTADADRIGVFGEYQTLTLQTDRQVSRVYMQDLAADRAFDVTDAVAITEGAVVFSGDLIATIGRSAQPATDTSEPGVVIVLQ